MMNVRPDCVIILIYQSKIIKMNQSFVSYYTISLKSSKVNVILLKKD
jgi:hypothetical protein